jgi:hypothetical protein
LASACRFSSPLMFVLPALFSLFVPLSSDPY